MNKKFDHENFPSWEKQYNLQQDEKNIITEEKLIALQKAQLLETYPNIKWSQLKKQNDYYETDDGCTHYKDTVTGQIFSWDFMEDKWMQHGIEYHDSLMELFD